MQTRRDFLKSAAMLSDDSYKMGTERKTLS
jgi:hypothetical protein